MELQKYIKTQIMKKKIKQMKEADARLKNKNKER
jgi:hypothetical protein